MLRSNKKLIDIYEKSVGRGANLLLNLAPNREGLLESVDVKKAQWLGREIQRRYANPIKSTCGESDSLEIQFKSEQLIRASIIQEDIRKGQRIRSYLIEAMLNGDWKEICNGSSVGHKKIDRFKPIRTNKIRLRITDSLMPPIIKNFCVFC
jgi:alpha-L-fucosidase